MILPAAAIAAGAERGRAETNRRGHYFDFNRGRVSLDTGVEAAWGRVGQAWCLRGGRLLGSLEDVPSYDGHGIRIRGECDQYMWATDHPETFSIINGSGRELSPDDGIDGGNAGRCTPDNDAGSWQFNRSVGSATAFAQGNNWCFSIYIKAATAEDVGKEIRLTMQEGNGVDLVTTNSDDFVLTVDWVRHEMYIPITLAATNRIECVLNRAGSELNRAELYDICCPMLNKGTKARDFIHNPGADGSFVTRTTEAADGAGNGLSIPLPDDMKAAMGELVTRERLGPNLITNGTFDDWTDDNPDGWEGILEGDPAPIITEVSGACRMYSPGGDWVQISQSIFEVGKKYQLDVDLLDVTAGALRYRSGAISHGIISSVGHNVVTFVATGGDFRLSRNTVTDVTFDNVVVREVITEVLTPTGDELIDDVTAWSMTSGIVDNGVDAITFTTSCPSGGSARKDILLADRTYVVSGIASEVTGPYRIKNDDSSFFEISSSGPFIGVIKCGTSDTVFRIESRDPDIAAVITNISVEKVQPKFTLVYEFIAKIASADIPDGGIVNIGSFLTASRFDTPAISRAGSVYFLQCGRFGARNMGITTKPWSVGDKIKVVVSVDAALGERVLAFKVNSADALIVTASDYDAATASQYPVGDTAYICADSSGGDNIFPMTIERFSFRPYLIDATQEAVTNA